MPCKTHVPWTLCCVLQITGNDAQQVCAQHTAFAAQHMGAQNSAFGLQPHPTPQRQQRMSHVGDATGTHGTSLPSVAAARFKCAWRNATEVRRPQRNRWPPVLSATLAGAGKGVLNILHPLSPQKPFFRHYRQMLNAQPSPTCQQNPANPSSRRSPHAAPASQACGSALAWQRRAGAHK